MNEQAKVRARDTERSPVSEPISKHQPASATVRAKRALDTERPKGFSPSPEDVSDAHDTIRSPPPDCED